jgi:uncharacterized damage-inducible protein DinB
MTSAEIGTLLDYHYWARDRLLDAVSTLTPEQFDRDLGSSFKSIRATLVHLLSAEWGWYERWHGRSPKAPLPADQFPDAGSIASAWRAHETKMRDFIGPLGDAALGRAVDYTLFSGAAGSTPLWQMIQHVVNHGSYHRGQITTMLRQLGAAPAKSMDLIAFYRL